MWKPESMELPDTHQAARELLLYPNMGLQIQDSIYYKDFCSNILNNLGSFFLNTLLGNPFQNFTPLIVRNLVLISSLNVFIASLQSFDPMLRLLFFSLKILLPPYFNP